jgi:serine/threonine protein kinase
MAIEGKTHLDNGRYELRAVLGEGAQGVTYDALDVQAGRAVAIKRFDVRGARSWKDVELAEREARVLATLDHPLMPRYFTHFEEEGALYLVMETIEGETLDAMRRRLGPLPEDEVRRFLACADRALTYLHGRGSPVIHRDIKPRNVVRRADGSYVFVDFGAVAELVLRRGASTIVGTIGYMAPEQLQGRALPATDVYAVGATALASLTGAEPETLPHRGLRVDVRTALAGRASAPMIASLEQMLEPDPDRRATSLGAALEARPVASVHPLQPVAVAVAPDTSNAKEDAAVKSIGRLLWLLWGLGWIVVPLLLRQFGDKQMIPIIMFGSLAALFVVTWHKGAIIRALLRAALESRPRTEAGIAAKPSASALPRQRLEVAREEQQQVRVHTSDLQPEELVGDTDLERKKSERALRAR